MRVRSSATASCRDRLAAVAATCSTCAHRQAGTERHREVELVEPRVHAAHRRVVEVAHPRGQRKGECGERHATRLRCPAERERHQDDCEADAQQVRRLGQRGDDKQRGREDQRSRHELSASRRDREARGLPRSGPVTVGARDQTEAAGTLAGDDADGRRIVVLGTGVYAGARGSLLSTGTRAATSRGSA